MEMVEQRSHEGHFAVVWYDFFSSHFEFSEQFYSSEPWLLDLDLQFRPY